MPWRSGSVFAAHFDRGVGLESSGKPSTRCWKWSELKNRYEKSRQELKNKGQDYPYFPEDADTTRRWIEGETRVQRRYRQVLLAVFYGVDRAFDGDTELDRAWDHDDQIARERRRHAIASGWQNSLGHTQPNSLLRIEARSAAADHEFDPGSSQSNWQGGTPPLPPDKMAAPKELIGTILKKLRDGSQPAACVLWGQPGVGKSTLAALVAPIAAPDAECPLYWVKFRPDGLHDLEEKTTPATALHGLAKTLSRNLPPDASSKALVAEIKNALSGKPYVLVCDNVRDESELNEYDFRSRSGIVLATSLSPSWEYVEQIEIGVWQRQRCRDYIRVRIPQKIPAQNPDAVLDSLAKTVGYLPLGLAQSTAYIRYTGLLIKDYIARFEYSAKRLLGARKLPKGGRGPAYKTIRSTCYMLFDLLTIIDDAAAPDLSVAPLCLLCVMGILDIAGASRALLLKIFSCLFTSAPEDLFDFAMMRLRDFSLISETDSGSEIFLHQMTYVAARCWIEEKYAQRAAPLIAHFKNSFRYVKQTLQTELREEPGLQTRISALHTESLLRLKDLAATECAGRERWALLETLASALAEAFRWPRLRASISYVCDLADKEPNPKLRLFCNGVRLSIKSGSALGEAELVECEEGLVEILAKYPEVCGGVPDWRRVASFQRSLSGTRFDLGNLEGGLAAADASLKTLVEVQDHYSIDVIRGHGGRGRTLDALGRSEEAIEEYQKALEALKLQANRTFICDGPGCLDRFRGGIS